MIAKAETRLTRAEGATIFRGMAAIAWGGAVVAETVGDALERVHRQTSPAMGQLCLALEKRRVRPDTIRDWARTLRQGSEDLLKLAEKMEKQK